MIKQLAIALVLLVALASGQDTEERKPDVKKDSDKKAAITGVQHYDWKQWFSKTGNPKEASKDGQKNWDKWMSFSHIDPPSGLSKEYSFKPYSWKDWITKEDKEQSGSSTDGHDWQQWLSGSYVPTGVQYYDWQQWLSKTGGKSGGSGKGGNFDWKKFLSNSYNKIPSGLEEKYSFSPIEWEKFLSGSYIPSGVQYYDWQQWLSKKDGKSTSTGKDGTFDWKKFLSNSYNKIPSGLEEKYSFSPIEWEKFLSGSYIPGGVQYYDWQQWLSKKDGKSTSTGKDGTFDWKKFLSNSYNKIPSGIEEKYSFSPIEWEKFLSGSYIPSGVQYYDWQQWLSKKDGKSTSTGKDGTFDWKKFLSNSYNKIPSGIEEKYSFSPIEWEKFLSGSYIPSGVQYYDWQQWLSKKDDKSTSTGKDGTFDWKKFLSNSYNKIPSGLEEKYSFSPIEWEKFLSGSYIPSGVQYYDWQQWLSKKDGKSTSTGKDGTFDWKKFLSNSYNKIPSGLEEKYSFSPIEWEKFLSGSYIPGGVQYYDWQQWLSKKDGKSTSTGKDGTFDWKKFLSNSYNKIPSGIEEKYSFSPIEWEKFLSGSYIPGGVQYYDWQQWLSKKDGKSTSTGKDGTFDWKKFLSNSYNKIPSGLEEKYSFSPIEWEKFLSGSYIPGGVQYYDWQQWLSKKDGKSTSTGKDGTFDWKKFLSNSYNKIPSGIEEKYSFSPIEWEKFLSGSYIPSGVQYYDWQQWLSKKDGKSTSTGKDGTFDWKKFLSNSYNKIPSGLEEKYSFSPIEWEKFLSQ